LIVTNQALVQFLQAVAADPAIQAQCGDLKDLTQLIAMGQAYGFEFSAMELQLWAHHEAFNASWWPWSGAGRESRLAFFRGGFQD
jgi:hypothetical protein